MAITHTQALMMMYGGSAGLAGNVFWLFRTMSFRAEAQKTTGVVVENVLASGGRGAMYCPRFRFRSLDGREWTVDSNVGSTPPAFQVGQQVTVLFKPEDPGSALIDSVTQLWLLPVALSVGTAVVAAVGFFHR